MGINRMKKALIYGFLGRNNFGDELMLHLHKEILEELGYEVSYTTDVVNLSQTELKYIDSSFIKNMDCFDYDLIIYGGGALPLFYGIELLTKIKFFSKNCTIIASSINPAITHKIDFCNLYNSIFDGMIFRSTLTDEMINNIKIPKIYLPDIATTIDSQYSNTKNNKIAIIIRKDGIFFNGSNIIYPKEDHDLVITSSSDKNLLKTFKIYPKSIIDITEIPIMDRVNILKEYSKILSYGRFHPPLLFKNNPENTCYLYPFLQNSYNLNKDTSLYYSWENFKEFEKHQACEDAKNNLKTKTGNLSINFYKYPSSEKHEYKKFMQNILQ